MITEKSLSLEEIVEYVAKVYPDHFLQSQLKQVCSPTFQKLKSSEALATYLMKEFSDLYDPASATPDNVTRIVSSLERSQHLLGRVIEELEQLGGAT